MNSLSKTLYQDNPNSHRIFLLGSLSPLVHQLIIHTLRHTNRKFKYYHPDHSIDTEGYSPIVIYTSTSPHSDFRHHMILLARDLIDGVDGIDELLNQTPKAGIIFYPKDNGPIESVACIKRTDVQAVPYIPLTQEVHEHVSHVVLPDQIKIPLLKLTPQQLEDIAAAYELLKKISISDHDFQMSISSFPF